MPKTALDNTHAAEQPFHMGDRIRKARELVDMDRQTFAETIGIHRDTLAKYEDSGKAKRSALITIAWATPVRLEWLETGELPFLKTVGPAGIEPTTSTVKSQRFSAPREVHPVVSLSDFRAEKAAS